MGSRTKSKKYEKNRNKQRRKQKRQLTKSKQTYCVKFEVIFIVRRRCKVVLSNNFKSPTFEVKSPTFESASTPAKTVTQLDLNSSNDSDVLIINASDIEDF